MELPYLSALAKKAKESRTPMWGQIEITPICNLKCRMCYVHKPEEDSQNAGRLQPASFWIETVKKACEKGLLVLSITGGETLTYPELDELMDALTKMGILISFNTNGTLIDEKRVQWFKRYHVAKINISLYGGSNETYEKLTGMKDGFDRVSKAVDLLMESGENVFLNSVVVPENVHEQERMYLWAKERGLELHSATYLFPPRGCAGKKMEDRLAPELAANTGIEIEKIKNGQEIMVQKAANTSLLLKFIEKVDPWQENILECRGGVCSWFVNWQGDMQPCAMFYAVRESLYAKTFDEAWEQIVKRIEAIEGPVSCRTCRKKEICPVCKAAVYQETAGFEQKPEYLCEYTNCLYERILVEGKGIENTVPDCGDFRSGGCTE